MNEHDKQMTGAEILSIISGMINHAKTRFSETGQLYVLRGFELTAPSTCSFAVWIIPGFILRAKFKKEN